MMNHFHSKKVWLFLCALACFIWLVPVPVWAQAGELPQVEARSYFLMDFHSGAVLAKKNEDEPYPPASMTKMMSALVVLDEIAAGKLSWDDVVTVSKRAADVDEAQIHLTEGEEITVKELFDAMLIYSANDATVALAEHVGGSEEGFVKRMNEKAKEIGMKHTQYQGATGLDLHLYPDPPKVSGKHVMSARDTAILAATLIQKHPEVLEVTAMTKYTVRPGTDREQTVNNWNRMLPDFIYEYPGVDGVKTGHTNAAGYCFTGTAQREGYRLISVVMGTENDQKRFSETKKLLDYGYDQFSFTTVVPDHGKVKGQESLALPNGVERTVPVVVEEAVSLPIQDGEQRNYSVKVEFDSNVRAPLEKGTIVGKAYVFYDGRKMEGVKPINVVTAQSMEEGSWIRLFFRSVGDEISSWFD